MRRILNSLRLIFNSRFDRQSHIDVDDYVKHKPTGEEWVVAAVDVKNQHLYWFGYPFGGYADLKDCVLTRKATRRERQVALNKLANLNSTETPVHLARKRLAKS